MFAIIKRYKKTSVAVFIALSVWVYQELRPTIISILRKKENTWGKYLLLAELLISCILKITRLNIGSPILGTGKKMVK